MDRERGSKGSNNHSGIPIVKRADIRRASMNSHPDVILGMASAGDNAMEKVSKQQASHMATIFKK